MLNDRIYLMTTDSRMRRNVNDCKRYNASITSKQIKMAHSSYDNISVAQLTIGKQWPELCFTQPFKIMNVIQNPDAFWKILNLRTIPVGPHMQIVNPIHVCKTDGHVCPHVHIGYLQRNNVL